MRQFHFFCKQRYLKYTVLSLLLCPLSSSAAEEWKEVKGESTTNIVESTQQKKQKRVITGVVRDSDTNEPIIGASVWLKNSSVGAVTDIDGKYSITIEGVGGVLEFSYIGMKSKRIKYTGQARLDIVMESDAQTMDEIVVQADRLDRDNMGITARQQVSATQKVTMDELVAVSPVTSLEDALQGQLGGVDIVLGGGDPGARASIQIRGTSTLNANSEPLIVIDGIPYPSDISEDTDFSNLNNEDLGACAVLVSQFYRLGFSVHLPCPNAFSLFW